MPTKAEIEKENARLKKTVDELNKLVELEKQDKSRLAGELVEREKTIEDLENEQEESLAATVLEATGHREARVGVWGNPYIVITDPETGVKSNHKVSMTLREGGTKEETIHLMLEYADALQTLVEMDPARFGAKGVDVSEHNKDRLRNGNGNGSNGPLGNADPERDKLDVPGDRPVAPQPANAGRLPTPVLNPEETFVGWFPVKEMFWDFKEGTPPDQRKTDFFLVVKCGRFTQHGILAYSDTAKIPGRVREGIGSGSWAVKDPVSSSVGWFPPEMKYAAVVEVRSGDKSSKKIVEFSGGSK